MFLVFFVLWIVFNGRWTTEIAVIGAIVAGVLYAFCCKFMDFSPRKDWQAIRRVPQILRYLWTLLREIVKANLAVTRIVLRRKPEIHPQLVTFRTNLSGISKSVLADSITITPGTITAASEGDELTVHCLDASFAEGLAGSELERQLLAMQEGDGRNDG